jgi:hypothetical protein
LHDGEVVTMPPPRPVYISLSSRVIEWLHPGAKGRGCVANSFPYRRAADFQYWRAGIAYLTHVDFEAHRKDDYIADSPLIIESLSPSNRRSTIERQRLAASSGGTREFWGVDPESRTIEAFAFGKPSRVYGKGEKIAISGLPGVKFPVGELSRD